MVNGQLIAHYRMVRKLGSGGMGEVYLAEDTKLDRPVALKLLSSNLARDKALRHRFLTEAKAASALNHPNVCVIYEIGETAEQRPFIAMEFLDGPTLDARLRLGPMDALEVVEIGIQVADALEAAHAKGIVHRDIKPANLCRDARRQVKVLDFGIAKRTLGAAGAMSPATQVVTQPGLFLGTPRYMSPEQAQGKALDRRTDIFSLGVVLYELATGRAPFAGDEAEQTIQRLVHLQPEPMRAHNELIPDELERIVRKCLEKDREYRYQSALELVVDLKNLSRQLSAPSSAIGTAITEAAPLEKSVAVLPFVNLSADAENEYFSDGITEDLITALSRVPRLRVPARGSSFSFKGKAQDLRQIAQSLRVSTLLEGSVRKAGNRLRVTAQLTKVADGFQLWSAKFDRELRDVFAIQDEITQAIVEALKIQFNEASRRSLIQVETKNLRAYQLYLEGRYYMNQRGAGLLKSLRYYELALLEDPDYAPAHAGLAFVHGLLGFYQMAPQKESFHKARTCGEKAQSLDPQLGQAYTAQAFTAMMFDWDLPKAEALCLRAIELNPNDPIAHYFYGNVLAVQQRIEEALREEQRAVQLDPLSDVVNGHYGFILLAIDLKAAIAQSRKALEINPDCLLALSSLGEAHLCGNQYEEAIIELKRAVGLTNRQPFYLALLGYAYGAEGNAAKAKEVLAEFDRQSASRYVSPVARALVRSGLGDYEQALEHLEEAYEERNSWLCILHARPYFRPLESDPRFQDLLRRIGVSRPAARQPTG